MMDSSHLECHPKSKTSRPQFCILNPPFSMLQPQIFSIQPQFSKFNFSSSILENIGYLTQKVLKIARFPLKCPQLPLALLAAFSRSADTLQTPSRHPTDSFQTPSRHHTNTLQTFKTLSRTFSYISTPLKAAVLKSQVTRRVVVGGLWWRSAGT